MEEKPNFPPLSGSRGEYYKVKDIAPLLADLERLREMERRLKRIMTHEDWLKSALKKEGK